MADGGTDKQEARIAALWEALDTRRKGKLDFDDLRAGLRHTDHPLKDAGSLLTDVFKRVDLDGDGTIYFSEFSTFVKHAESELKSLFESIDRDHNGKLDKEELRAAFTGAGIPITSARLDEFFTSVDSNHDGVISFEEWRNFLLFIPVENPGLRAVLSYYATSVKVNPEGDVHVSDETKQGAGTIPQSRFSLVKLFGLHAKPQIRHRPPDPTSVGPTGPASGSGGSAGAPVAEAPEEVNVHEESSEIEQTTLGWKTKLTAWVPVSIGYFIAGAVAGIVSRTTTAPLDRLKVYLIAQTNPSSKAVTAAKSGDVVQASKHAARPLRDAWVALWRAGGVRSLFAGNGLNVIKVMPESAIKFGAYEASKRAMSKIEGHRDPQKISGPARFVAGGIGGIVSQLFAYPLDTLKFRMQCETREGGIYGNKLIAETAKKMWKTNGFRAYYRGLTWGLVGQFPYSAIDLFTFESLKRAIIKRNMKKRGCDKREAAPGSVATAAIGGFSGAFGASVVYPINLLRTRLQTQGTKEHPRTYTGIVDCTKQTLKGEGVRGLFKGVTPNLIKVVPAVSITYVVYEGSKKLLDLP